ncbi:Dynein heavy chain 3, axonemal [Portunus trituberculatus]|uniref:Dynein heavy chain 3, axonemal n=1 Tax=Portunus trituberculatus TaxID=210409 RepID=A0A5B7H1B6_PORTR|nr:Dynein heavy chain 3, axonemal [Portunus trituberculatus]
MSNTQVKIELLHASDRSTARHLCYSEASTPEKYQDQLLGVIMTLVEATREVYKSIISTFLPTPAKSHYVFNLRDFSRVVGGILLVPNTCLTSVDKVIRLWLHETYRVFHDRLCDDNDRQKFFMIVRNICQETFHLELNSVLTHLVTEEEDVDAQHLNNLIFGNFMIPDAENPTYDEVSEREEDTACLKLTYLILYNFSLNPYVIIQVVY